uniref:Rab-GAP TBC domain-containing protein n=1 Tax=Steinernema glaseri TaxID=37863 RepID=A0A1I7YSF4_9BILA
MLRIWDCFLLEGPKVLFRFAIALLGIHETEILEKCDTISVMKVLKAAVKLTYDIDGLIKVGCVLLLSQVDDSSGPGLS